MDRLYVIVDRNLPAGLACAQVAHAATVAANRWEITERTYIIVLASPEGVNFQQYAVENIWDNGFVYFKEPDLDNRITTIAALNPLCHVTESLSLWTGEEGMI